jgi:methylated-DNA-[protein]-cysteine S-methyltransferase
MTSRTEPTCREIEPDIVAVAGGEAGAAASDAVDRHIARCAPCRDELERYRRLEGIVSGLRHVAAAGADPALARAELESRLADLKRRVIAFGIFESPLGPILIARTEQGVSMIEYLGSDAAARSRMERLAGSDARRDQRATERLHRELLEFLDGRRTGLDWTLDLRWAHSDFQRRVLEETARLPYGAVTSYGHIAQAIGAPGATRAVAQALRWNPIPIAVPCHRVIGGSGALTGYAGNKVDLKQRLLGLEGVPVVAGRELHVERRAMYHRYRDDGAYCLPTCGTILARPLALVTLFGSRSGAEALGLEPCSDCRPDLHPLPHV